MAWDFATDSDFERRLEWVDGFVRDEVQLLDFVVPNPRDVQDPVRQELIPPLQRVVKEHGLWSAHLPASLGGAGLGQVEQVLLNEVLGRTQCGPMVFGCQAPDSGNAEILRRYGTEEHQRAYLQPLLDGDIVSCFSATEPEAGADPTMYTTRAELDGDEWVINGDKWFSSGSRYAAFLLVMCVTEPDNPPHQRTSVLIVPRSTPGIIPIREVAVGIEAGDGIHTYLRYDNVRVPKDNLLGPRGGAFVVMQTRMGHARLALASRALGRMRQAYDLMCERAITRETKGERLSRKQLVQEHIAEAWLAYQQFRLLVLQTAWKLDRANHDMKAVRADIAAVKIMLPRVMQEIATRAAQVHGSLGVSHEMPFAAMASTAMTNAVADGPTEVHKVTLARQELSRYQPHPDLFPRYHAPTLRAQARERYAGVLARLGR